MQGSHVGVEAGTRTDGWRDLRSICSQGAGGVVGCGDPHNLAPLIPGFHIWQQELVLVPHLLGPGEDQALEITAGSGLSGDLAQGYAPHWLSGKEPACQCRRHGFDPGLGTIPHTSEQLSPRATLLMPVHPRGHAPQQEKPPQ